MQTVERVDACTASEIAAAVRQGALDPAHLLAECLERIKAHDFVLGSFATVRGYAAQRDVEMLKSRFDLAQLPLAGVPIAIKDNVAVAGEVQHSGSHVFDPLPKP